MQAYPNMDKKEIGKIKTAALNDARASVGASGKKTRIVLTDNEWDAIQAGAISDSKLTQILRFADPDSIKQRAMPKTTKQLSTAKVNKMKSMKNSGYTIGQIAEALGVSTSTISKYINN